MRQIEELRQKKPQMPQYMRDMVAAEVARQIGAGPDETNCAPGSSHSRGGRNRRRTALLLALAAALTCGATVFAAIQAELRATKMANYAQEIGIYGEDSAVDSPSDGEAAALDPILAKAASTSAGTESGTFTEIPNVTADFTYLPDDMVRRPSGDASYDDTYADASELYGMRAFHYFLYRMDLGDTAFRVTETNVLHSEEFSGEHNGGIYLELSYNFDKKLYLFFPELHYVAELWGGADLTKEELLAVGDGLRLTETEDPDAAADAQNWSDVLRILADTQGEEEEIYDEEMAARNKHTAETIAREAHAIGESFALKLLSGRDWPEVQAAVTDVQISDTLAGVPDTFLDDGMRSMADDDGNLLDDTIRFIRPGDGVDTMDEDAGSTTFPRRMVTVTLSLTNATENDLRDLLLYGELAFVNGEGDAADYYHLTEDPDMTALRFTMHDSDEMSWMAWYTMDHAANGNGNNYIANLAPGETTEVTMGFFADEDQLAHMYFAVGDIDVEDPSMLGAVDLRQN